MLSSTREALKEEKARLTNALLENNYSKWVGRQFSNLSGKATEMVEEHLMVTVFLPYVYGVSEALKRLLKPLGVGAVMKPNQRP